MPEMLDVLRKVPCGVLPVLGPAGTGKTQLSMLLAHLRMLNGAVPAVVSTSNAAVTNGALRFRVTSERQGTSDRIFISALVCGADGSGGHCQL